MDTLAKADIFFFISSIGTAIVFVLAAVALIYAISLLSQLKRWAARAEYEADKALTFLYVIKRIMKTFI